MVAKVLKGHDEQTLPKKEADIFRNILKLYERKEYKKGLKSAETILSKYPEHGETLSIKGLLLNCLDRKEESTEFARKGLLKNLNSHVCWHLYGLIYRSDHNYTEAAKCYLNALKHDPENLQILRDLSLLQVHIRDLKGYVETRNKILAQKSNIRANWLAYATALHMTGSYDTALKVLDAFYGTLSPDREVTYEDSELILYRNQVVGEQGKLEEALKHLDASKDKIKDDFGFQMRRAELLLGLCLYEQAEVIYRALIDIEPDDYGVHRLLQCAVLRFEPDVIKDVIEQENACALPCTDLCMNESQLLLLKETYKKFRDMYPLSSAICQILLSMSEGNGFSILLAEYLKGLLSRCIPILTSDLDFLYVFPKFGTVGHPNCERKDLNPATEVTTGKKMMVVDHVRAETLLDVCDMYIKSLRETKRFPGEDDSTPIHSPEVEMWALYLKSEILEKFGRLKESLALAEECISLGPTVTEVIQRKARVLKKMGAYNSAAEVMDSARKLDLSDKYLNNKAAKYFLRADRITDAEATVVLFTIHEETPQNYFFEMQCSWYELEWAKSELRQGNLPLCLKKAFAVVKHFEDFVEDQFDFHSYCLRRETLRVYVDMLRIMDKIQGHIPFCRAATLIVKCYLRLVDNPPKETSVTCSNDCNSNLSSAERKKAKQKAKKEEKRKLLEEQKRREAIGEAAKGVKKRDSKCPRKPQKPVPVDPDPEGLLLAKKDPLTEAARMVSILSLHAPSSLETWLLGFDVALRKQKWLMALRAIFRGRECNGGAKNGDPAVMSRVAQFFNAISRAVANDKKATEFGEHASAVISDAKMELLNELDVPLYTDKLIDECRSLPDYVEAAKCVMLVFGDAKRSAELITKGLQTGRGLNAKSCRDTLITMKELGLSKEDISAFQLKCLELYPLGSAFGAAYRPENQAVTPNE